MLSGVDSTTPRSVGRKLFPVTVTGVTWLAQRTFEIRFRRPPRFEFSPGQKIGIVHNALYRDYTLIGATQDGDLGICVRLMSGGAFSPMLARAHTGDSFQITPAFGYFTYQPLQRSTVFVATGTGIAPFVAFVRAGADNFHLLHGVRCDEELYYRDLMVTASKSYTACLSELEEDVALGPDIYRGFVTDYLEHRLLSGAYDFYLCGRSEMLRDATRVIDRRFPGSRVFSELFF